MPRLYAVEKYRLHSDAVPYMLVVCDIYRANDALPREDHICVLQNVEIIVPDGISDDIIDVYANMRVMSIEHMEATDDFTRIQEYGDKTENERVIEPAQPTEEHASQAAAAFGVLQLMRDLRAVHSELMDRITPPVDKTLR